MLELLFALTGIVFGIILANISPEEILPGKKYFLWLKRILLLGILILMVYFSLNNLFILIIPGLLIITFIINLKVNSNYLEIAYYSLFIIFYLFSNQIILSILFFIYGLPTGTLLFRNKL
tara:strand:+ start:79 stop:438 length:360 start_codon:yes stop_codon:yes gene_type:complete